MSLEDSLKSAFNQPHVRLTRKPTHPGGRFHVRLENGPRNAETDDALEPVMAILTADHHVTTFSCGFVAAFVLGATYEYVLQSASLTMFHEIIAVLTPLFRAEWDQLGVSTETSTHAQPHWHFVQSPEQIESIVRMNMGSSSETAEFAPEQKGQLFHGLADCGKFHFAMTSLLDEKKISPYKESFDSANFPKWFKSLTKYIAGQIAYLVSHMPPTAATRVFVPTGRP